MAHGKPKFLEGLACDALESAPVSIDWSAAHLDYEGDGESGWRYWEGVTCDKCGAVLVLTGGGDEDHSDLDSDSKCEGHVGLSEGPMMNYWYPVRLRDPEDAARKISHLPLCVVEVEGQTGLALTGGGMDLSWEICAAFVALGFYPPTHFAGLPEMGGRGTSASDKRLMRACEESFRIAASWASRGIERLRDLRKRAAERAAERKARAAAESAGASK